MDMANDECSEDSLYEREKPCELTASFIMSIGHIKQFPEAQLKLILCQRHIDTL